MQQAVPIRFFVCSMPDFYAVMHDCDRDLYQWIAQIPSNNRPAYLNDEYYRIANATYQRQWQHVQQCEARRYAAQPQSPQGLRLTVASQVAGGGSPRRPDTQGLAARLSVPFAPQAPAICPPIKYYLLHKVDAVGINYYPQNTSVAFAGGQPSFYDGIGPWAGGKVMFITSKNSMMLRAPDPYGAIFSAKIHVQNGKVFDHWVHFKPFDDPAPPASLEARGEAFDLAALQVQVNLPYNGAAPEGQRGVGWQIFDEYTHLESGQFWVWGGWYESASGWNPVGLGGFGFDQEIFIYRDHYIDLDGDFEGTWRHRVCVYDFKLPPAAVTVRYDGVVVENAVSSILPLATTPYEPGVSSGIAMVEETVKVYTVGITKASFRILGIDPVPGFGVRFTIKVVNELHFAACIVTPFLSGIEYRSLQNNEMHFRMPKIWVVRNLDAHSESAPISILVPMEIIEPGNWPLRNRHWNFYNYEYPYAAPLGQFADGIYGTQFDSHGNLVGFYPDIGRLLQSAYMISSPPSLLSSASLLAGYLENGDKVWYSLDDMAADPDRLLMTLPVHKAPGAEVPYVPNPYSNGAPSSTEHIPFLCYFEWSAEYRVSVYPEIWEPRSGYSVLGLDLPTAIARYGRYMTLSVAAGRPMWSPYYGKWITVFDAWPGGDINELETYIVDNYLRPGFESDNWRNFQYTTLKPPYLTTNFMWWFESNPISDYSGRIQALTLIKETGSPDTVDVVLMGQY